MAVNRNWCRIEDGRLVFAPTWLKIGDRIVINPSDEQYLAAGWMRNAVQPPKPPEDMMTSSTRYEVVCEGGLYSVIAVYEYAPVPKVPRVFSKLYLILALKKRGLYEQFKAMLASAGLEDLWIAANELNDGYDGFDSFVAQAKTDLGLTDAEVEEILGEAVAR